MTVILLADQEVNGLFHQFFTSSKSKTHEIAFQLKSYVFKEQIVTWVAYTP